MQMVTVTNGKLLRFLRSTCIIPTELDVDHSAGDEEDPHRDGLVSVGLGLGNMGKMVR